MTGPVTLGAAPISSAATMALVLRLIGSTLFSGGLPHNALHSSPNRLKCDPV